MNSLKGQFLVASPYLQDANFVHSVVLLIDHNEEGAFGVVLNRPAENTIQDLWQKLGQGTCQRQEPVFLGGPVSGPLLALHGDPDLGEQEILPGVYLTAQREHLERLVLQAELPCRLLVGHAGWAGGQLENELSEGAWMTLPATAELVFSDPANLWRVASQQVGQSFLSEVLHIKHLPHDVNMN